MDCINTPRIDLDPKGSHRPEMQLDIRLDSVIKRVIKSRFDQIYLDSVLISLPN